MMQKNNNFRAGQANCFVPGLMDCNFSHNNYHMKFISHGLMCDDLVYFEKKLEKRQLLSEAANHRYSIEELP